MRRALGDVMAELIRHDYGGSVKAGIARTRVHAAFRVVRLEFLRCHRRIEVCWYEQSSNH